MPEPVDGHVPDSQLVQTSDGSDVLEIAHGSEVTIIDDHVLSDKGSCFYLLKFGESQGYLWEGFVQVTKQSKQGAKRKAEESESESEDEEVSEVDAIMDHRLHGGVMKYKVLWLGYAEEDCTWEPACNLQENELFIVH